MAGLFLAVTAGVMAFITIQRVMNAPKAVEEPPRVKALVAARDIATHTLVADQDVTLRDVPPELVPEGGLADPREAVGKLTTRDIARGEIILGCDLLAPDYVGPQAALVMDPKQVIIAFPAGDLLSSSDVVRPGDRVDLMFTFDFSKTNPEMATNLTALTVLQDVRVAGIIYGPAAEQQKVSGHGPARALLLALDPQDALVLKYFRDAGAAVDLALRSPAAQGPFEVTPVDDEYLLQRYRIQWQAKK